ncbi:MAG: hypothetical protein HYV04_01535, partial [Deltaproteobacteria bacterium]|nr:hypothetical protein [Deltaproteobacteria bacterium]
MDTRDYLQIIWRRRWLVLSVAVAVFGIAMWHSYRTVPVYEAQATIQFSSSSGPVLLDRLGPVVGASRGIETEIEILKSRVVGERTAIRMQRHYALSPLPPGVSVELSDVKVTEKTKRGMYTVTFMDDAGGYRVRDPEGNYIGEGKPGRAFESGVLSFALSRVSAKAGTSVQILVQKLAAVANSLRGSLRVDVIRSTDIVNLKVRGTDPVETAQVVNAFAETYVDFTREQKLQQLIGMRRFLQKQIEEFRKDLLRDGQALAGGGLASQQTESIFGRLRGGESPVGTGQSDVRYQLARRLLDLEMNRAALQFTYTPDHRIIAQLDREIAEHRSRLSKQLTAEKEDLPFLDRLRESQVKLGMYSYMLQKQQETRIAEASESGSARIIDHALPPETPVSPDVSRNLKVGGMLGLSLGIGLALFLGFLDRSVKNVQDLEERVGLPAFGAIPQMPSSVPRSFLGSVTSVKELAEPSKFLVGINGARTRAAEAYRALRTSMEFAIPEAPARAFLFTSSGPGEGKSLTVANLAIAMSQMGRRVLIVDADL